MWNPPTLQDALNNNEPIPLAVKSVGQGKFKYKCDCGSWVFASVMIDVRKLTPPNGQEWACDGCWTHWERNQIKVTKAKKQKDAKAWRKEWIKAHGAPADIVAKY